MRVAGCRLRAVDAAPGARYGPADPAAPAASRLPCGARALRGLAELATLHFAQTAASPDPQNAALLGGAEGIGQPVPRTGLGGGAKVAPSGCSPRMQPLPVHVGGRYALGRPLRHRRAAQRQADQGRVLFERSEFTRTPPDASSAGQPEGPVTSAGTAHTARRRTPNRLLPTTHRRRPRTDYFARTADLGLNALHTSSCVSRYGPPIRSMQ